MKGVVTGITDEEVSRTEGKYRYIFFRVGMGVSSRAARTHVVSKYRNFKRWKPVIEEYQRRQEQGRELVLKGLRLRTEGVIDADSPVQIDKTDQGD